MYSIMMLLKVHVSVTRIMFSLAGSYHVILDEKHFVDLLKQHVSPPPATVSYLTPSHCKLSNPSHGKLSNPQPR